MFTIPNQSVKKVDGRLVPKHNLKKMKHGKSPNCLRGNVARSCSSCFRLFCECECHVNKEKR